MDEWDEQAEHDRDLEYESRQADEQEHTELEHTELEHMRRMLRFGLDWFHDNASKTKCEHPLQEECDHKYFENENAPLGVTCIRCGHFVGAWQ